MKILLLYFLILTFLIEFALSALVNVCTSLNLYWNTQICAKCSDSNGVCDSSGSLIDCLVTYYLSTNGTKKYCKKCPTFCNTCLSQEVGIDEVCTSCTTNYYLIEGTCQLIAACGIVNLTLGICQGCNAGYYFNEANICTKCDASCYSCFNASTCYVCNPGYSLLSSSFYCTKCFAGDILPVVADTSGNNSFCTSCTDDELCTQCMSGYLLATNLIDYNAATDKICYKCPSNCSVCDGQTKTTLKCLICDSGMLFTSASSCISCTVEVAECTECDLINDKAVCKKCGNGYYLNKIKNTCIACPNNSYLCYCNESSCSNIEIVQCIKDYNLINGSCFPHNHCDLFSLPTTCTQCSVEYYLTGNNCVAQKIENCIEYASNTNTCIKCKDKFYLSSNQCVANNDGCQLQSESGKCDVYNNYYYLESSAIKLCAPTNSATECAYLSSSAGSVACQVINKPDNATCDVFDPIKSGCKVWNQDSKGKCDVCVYDETTPLDNKRFYLQSATGKCVRYQKRCSQFNTTSEKCERCSFDLTLNHYYALTTDFFCIPCEDISSGNFKCQSMTESVIQILETYGELLNLSQKLFVLIISIFVFAL